MKVAPATQDTSSAIIPKVQGKINTFKIGNYTYIPLVVVPKVYRPIFKTVVKSKPPTIVIKVNGKVYAPLTHITVKPVTIDGITYIPVHKTNDTKNVNTTIVPEVEGKINTFKIGNHTYIPLQIIPKVHSAVFKNKIAPVKKPNVITPIIKINDQHFVPITNATVNKVVVGGVTYIPVNVPKKSVDTTHAIVPKVEGPINTFKIGNKTYIPLSVIPKVFSPIFRNKLVPVNKASVARTVIRVNGEHFVPLTGRKHK